MLVAIEYLGKVGVGVTLPQFFRAHDGNIYVVKFQNTRLGSRVLVSELFAAKLGKLMGLCFPPSDIIELDNTLLAAEPYLQDIGLEPGKYFASRYLACAEYLGRDRLTTVVNIADIAGVILFDHMFHNADRAKNQKNLLLRLENEHYIIYAIDNSHLFRSSRWTIESLENLGTKIKIYYYQHYRKLLKDLLNPKDFLPYVESARAITDAQIDCIVKEIPGEWLPEASDRLALAAYAKLRRDMAEEVFDKLLRCIPRSRGGRKWLFSSFSPPKDSVNENNQHNNKN